MNLKRPPMGWNSYDYYCCIVNEDDVKKNAAYMAEHLKPHGYEYIVIDIQWYARHADSQIKKYQYIPFGDLVLDSKSRLIPDPERFPSSAGGKGFGPLADYIHSLGLKFGIHIMRGIPRIAAHMHMPIPGGPGEADHDEANPDNLTDLNDSTSKVTAADIADPASICFWNPDMYGLRPDMEASQGYYDSIIKMYADWGVDFIKCDDICRMDADSAKGEIEMLHEAIEKSGRDIVLSLSPGPAKREMSAFYHKNAEMWRITDDFWDSWKQLLKMFDYCRTWQGDASHTGFPDNDMLPVGNLSYGWGNIRRTNFTKDEVRTMMTLWCITKSPLMIGSLLTDLDDETFALLTNDDILSINEHTSNAREVYRTSDMIIWCAEGTDVDDQKDGSVYKAFFNISDEETALDPKAIPGTINEDENTENSGKMCKDNVHKFRYVKELWSGSLMSLSENGAQNCDSKGSSKHNSEDTIRISPHSCAVLHFL